MCCSAVRDWLLALTMEVHLPKFMQQACDTEMCKLFKKIDYLLLGIKDANHCELLQRGTQLLFNSPEPELFVCSKPCALHAPDEINHDIFAESLDIILNCNPRTYINYKIKMDIPMDWKLFKLGSQDIVREIWCYSCIACPGLKFRHLDELADHIKEKNAADEAKTHEFGCTTLETIWPMTDEPTVSES